MIKEQNQGLAAELEGFSFKPRINKTSMDLSATMKSLNLRIPDMISESKRLLEVKRKEAAEQEVAECSFAPKRGGAKTSDMYLKKLGREKMVPDDLIRYELTSTVMFFLFTVLLYLSCTVLLVLFCFSYLYLYMYMYGSFCLYYSTCTVVLALYCLLFHLLVLLCSDETSDFSFVR